MDDAEWTVTDYDNWAGDPGNVPGHVAGIRARLSGLTQEEARSASERRRWPYLVNLETGHLQAHDLCWLCVVCIVHSGPGLPRLRACRRCLGMDRGYAAQLGLRHLLPVFDWPSPPVIDAKRASALDGWSREVIGRAWSAVGVMDTWRRERVQLARGWMDVPDGLAVDLYEWQRAAAAAGPGRWATGWAAYIDEHQPDLLRVLQSHSDREGARR